MKAIIFDMDGVLIDSEPLWRKAMIAKFNAVGLPFDDDRCMQTTGLRIDEVTQHWYNLFPWPNVTPHQLAMDVIDEMIRLINIEGEAMPGVYETLKMLHSANYKIGLASSSSMVLIKAVVKKLAIENYFDAIHSAEFEKYGKPHPDVYIHTANLLNTPLRNCIAIEDSLNGLISAKAALMKVIAIPEAHNHHHAKFIIADKIIHSMQELTMEIINEL